MTSVFESVLRVSAEAAVLALLVLGARLIVGRRPGLLLTLLYALVAVRLVVPFAVSSPLSVHNIWNEPQTQIGAALNDMGQNTVSDNQIPVLTDEPQVQHSPAAVVSDTVGPVTASAPQTTAESAAKSPPLSALEIAALIWVAGMIAMTGTILTGNALFMRRIRRNRAYDAPEFTALLNECSDALGLRRKTRVLCASETGTAAVYGVFRPVLLISPASFDTLTKAQQRHVLLHELSHIRRRDTLVCASATVLNIVHWFNPLVWIVFALMRRDIEVQCDAHVFRGLPGAQRTDYAATLLKLAGPVQTPRLAPALFISKANIKRRIVMIMKYKRKSALFTAVALLLTVLVAVTGCTTAVDQKAEPESAESAVVEAAPNATPTPVSGDYKLLGTYTLDYSTCANDTALVNNIKKAAALLDGIELPFDTQLILSDKLLPLTEENGWANAPWTSWETTTESSSEGSIHTLINSIKGSEDMQEVGGGIEFVMLAIRIAADTTGLSYMSGWSDDGENFITESSFDLKNESYSNVILSVGTENNAVTASFYGTENPTTTAAEPELMSTFTLDNSPSPYNRPSRMDNIQIAADMLNGTVVKPGETISLNDILGPRNEETAKTVGWTLASGIKDGTYTSNIGGGITAVATALYNAAIRAELGIAEVAHCSVPYELVDGGLDATISTEGPDLKINNPYESDVTIEATLDGTVLSISIYGPPMAHTVDFNSEKAADGNENPNTVYVYNTPVSPDGTQIEPGKSYESNVSLPQATFNVYKVYSDNDGNIIKRDLYETAKYRAISNVVYVNGPDPATAPDASATPVPTPTPSAAP